MIAGIIHRMMIKRQAAPGDRGVAIITFLHRYKMAARLAAGDDAIVTARTRTGHRIMIHPDHRRPSDIRVA